MGVSNKLEKLYKIKIFLKDELGQDEKWLEQSAKNPEESWKNLNQNTNNKLIEKAGILVANNPSHYANFDAFWKDFDTFADKLLDEYLGVKESKRILDELAIKIKESYFKYKTKDGKFFYCPYWEQPKMYRNSFFFCFNQVFNNTSQICPNKIFSKFYLQEYFNQYFNIVGNYYQNNNDIRFYNSLEKFQNDLQNNYKNDIFTFAKAHGIKVR